MLLLLLWWLLLSQVWYLSRYYPELLHPTRKRKRDRSLKRGQGAYALSRTKARGKLNQDGKGGRSANS